MVLWAADPVADISKSIADGDHGAPGTGKNFIKKT
jgi:hypothetical protein